MSRVNDIEWIEAQVVGHLDWFAKNQSLVESAAVAAQQRSLDCDGDSEADVVIEAVVFIGMVRDLLNARGIIE